MTETVETGPEHDQLATCAGTWDVAFTCWMQEGDAPVRAECSSLIESVCDGRYLRETISGEFADQPFLGTGTTGYDRAAKHYVATWYDNRNTGIVYMTGSQGKDGAITYRGSMVCPQQGPIDLRQVVEQESDDGRFTVTMFSSRKGEKGKKSPERKTMELVYTRRRP